MTGLIARRLLLMIPTLLIVTFGAFVLVQLAPRDPAVSIAGGTATPEEVAQVRQDYQLDDPVVTQYARWVGNALHGDLGESYSRKTSVAEELWNRFPVTIGLVVAAVIVALMLAIPLGLVSGLRPNGVLDTIARFFATFAVAVPNYIIGLVLVIIFGVQLKWLPPSGYEKFTESPGGWLQTMILPAIALGLAMSAAVQRQLRGALVDELDTNHIRTAWAIGGGWKQVVGRHGFKNAASPAVTIVGIQFTALIGGAVIIEQIFAIPGIGSYLLEAIVFGDIPVILGCVLVMTVVTVLASLAVDIAYALLNPRVRVG